MTSLRQINANRRNAMRSTGPKSALGKAKTGLNAKVHGLSSPSTFSADDVQAIKSLAQAFVDGATGDVEKGNAPIMALAYRAAEQQIMMCRVRDARHKAWELAKTSKALLERGQLLGAEDMMDPDGDPYPRSLMRLLKQISPHLFEAPCESDVERDVVALNLVSRQLKKLVRYERQAANARDRALRELEQAKTALLMG